MARLPYSDVAADCGAELPLHSQIIAGRVLPQGVRRWHGRILRRVWRVDRRRRTAAIQPRHDSKSDNSTDSNITATFALHPEQAGFRENGSAPQFRVAEYGRRVALRLPYSTHAAPGDLVSPRWGAALPVVLLPQRCSPLAWPDYVWRGWIGAEGLAAIQPAHRLSTI